MQKNKFESDDNNNNNIGHRSIALITWENISWDN